MNPNALLPSLPPASRILLIRLRSIGDTVLLTPALRLLKEWRPDLAVSVLLERRFHDLLRSHRCVDEVLDPGPGRGWQGVIASLRLVHRLRGKRFSLCINLHGGPRSAFLARNCGADWKAGFAHFRRQRVYDFTIPDARTILNQPFIHTAEHQAAALFWLGLPHQRIPPSELFIHESWRAKWKTRLQQLAIPTGRGYALLQPAALYSTKVWPPERFAELGRYLEDTAGLVPVFSCGPGESLYLDRVAEASRGPIRRLEGVSLGVFAAALEDARLFVGNDSGPAHMAAALGRPLVVIFGSSSSRIWGPWAGSAGIEGSGDRNFQVIQNAYDCNPCRGDRCYQYSQPECILSISFDQVRAAVDSILARAAARSET